MVAHFHYAYGILYILSLLLLLLSHIYGYCTRRITALRQPLCEGYIMVASHHQLRCLPLPHIAITILYYFLFTCCHGSLFNTLIRRRILMVIVYITVMLHLLLPCRACWRYGIIECLATRILVTIHTHVAHYLLLSCLLLLFIIIYITTVVILPRHCFHYYMCDCHEYHYHILLIHTLLSMVLPLPPTYTLVCLAWRYYVIMSVWLP